MTKSEIFEPSLIAIDTSLMVSLAKEKENIFCSLLINSSSLLLPTVPPVKLPVLALSEKTALLPKVTIKKPKAILGRETKESMRIGIVYGFSSLCDGIARKLKKRYCRDAKVIATGGFSMLIGPYCESVDKIDPDLTLKGLEIISR